MLALVLALTAAAAAGRDGGPLGRPSLHVVVTAAPLDLRLREPALAAADAPARVRGARAPSLLAGSAGFLAGDALALGVGAGTYALANAWVHSSPDDALGIGLMALGLTAAAALVLPPVLGTVAAGGDRARPGAGASVVLGGLVHLSGLIAAGVLASHGQRWAAAGVVLGVDATLAPWIVVRTLGAAEDAGGPEAPSAFAHSTDDAGPR